MSNSASFNIEDFADTISSHGDSPVNIVKQEFPSFTATTLDSIIAKAFPEK